MTRLVAYGTVVRIVAMSLTGLTLFLFTKLHGVVVGASALSVGVISEAVATRFMAAGVLKKLLSVEENGKDITFKEIINFYTPLVLTSFISLGVQPIVTFFMSQSVMPLESLAVLPVLNSLVFIFRAFGLSFQEVGVALIKTKKEYKLLQNSALMLAGFVLFGLAMISLTPLGNVWLEDVAGLSMQLSEFAKIPLMIYTIFPAGTVWINFQRSVLINVKNTKPITYASSIEVVGLLIVLIITVKFLSVIGALAAVIAYIIGRSFSISYLMFPFRDAKKIIYSR